jgi:hypothetical protein
MIGSYHIAARSLFRTYNVLIIRLSHGPKFWHSIIDWSSTNWNYTTNTPATCAFAECFDNAIVSQLIGHCEVIFQEVNVCRDLLYRRNYIEGEGIAGRPTIGLTTFCLVCCKFTKLLSDTRVDYQFCGWDDHLFLLFVYFLTLPFIPNFSAHTLIVFTLRPNLSALLHRRPSCAIIFRSIRWGDRGYNHCENFWIYRDTSVSWSALQWHNNRDSYEPGWRRHCQ